MKRGAKFVSVALLFALLLCLPAFGANHYIRSAAGGAGTGADWTNACTDFAGSCAISSMVRGDTYYVASGNYCASGCSFSTSASGTSLITIKGATVANHGTATGWSPSFSVSNADGGSQAVFGVGSINTFMESVDVSTSYWVFDGSVPQAPAVGGQLDGNTVDYGFLLKTPTSGQCPTGQYAVNVSGTGLTNLTFAHMANTECGQAYDNTQVTIGLNTNTSNVLLSVVYGSNAGGCLSTSGSPSIVIEYMFCHDNWSTFTNHGEAIGFQFSGNTNGIIRYSNIWNCAGTGGIITLQGAIATGFSIYGNVFNNCQGGNGAIGAGGDGQAWANTRLVGNTFINSSYPMEQCTAMGTACSSASGNVLSNNLFHASSCLLNPGGGSAITSDYDAYISCSGGTPPTETHGQIASMPSSIFLNYGANNFNLISAPGGGTNQINAGTPFSTSLPSGCTTGVDCENVDQAGNVRNVSTPARGALEFSSGLTPSVTIAAPAVNATVSGFRVPLTPTLSGITSAGNAEWQIDNERIIVQYGCTLTACPTYFYNSADFGNGPHAINVIIRDVNNNCLAVAFGSCAAGSPLNTFFPSGGQGFTIDNSLQCNDGAGYYDEQPTITTSTALTSSWSTQQTVTVSATGTQCGTHGWQWYLTLDGQIVGSLSGTSAGGTFTLQTQNFYNKSYNLGVVGYQLFGSTQQLMVSWQRSVTFSNTGANLVPVEIRATGNITAGKDVFLTTSGPAVTITGNEYLNDGTVTARTPGCDQLNNIDGTTQAPVTLSGNCTLTPTNTAGVGPAIMVDPYFAGTDLHTDASAHGSVYFASNSVLPQQYMDGWAIQVTGGSGWTQATGIISQIGTCAPTCRLTIISPSGPPLDFAAMNVGGGHYIMGPANALWISVSSNNVVPHFKRNGLLGTTYDPFGSMFVLAQYNSGNGGYFSYTNWLGNYLAGGWNTIEIGAGCSVAGQGSGQILHINSSISQLHTFDGCLGSGSEGTWRTDFNSNVSTYTTLCQTAGCYIRLTATDATGLVTGDKGIYDLTNPAGTGFLYSTPLWNQMMTAWGARGLGCTPSATEKCYGSVNGIDTVDEANGQYGSIPVPASSLNNSYPTCGTRGGSCGPIQIVGNGSTCQIQYPNVLGSIGVNASGKITISGATTSSVLNSANPTTYSTTQNAGPPPNLSFACSFNGTATAATDPLLQVNVFAAVWNTSTTFVKNNAISTLMSQAPAVSGNFFPSVTWPVKGNSFFSTIRDWMGNPSVSSHATLYFNYPTQGAGLMLSRQFNYSNYSLAIPGQGPALMPSDGSFIGQMRNKLAYAPADQHPWCAEGQAISGDYVQSGALNMNVQTGSPITVVGFTNDLLTLSADCGLRNVLSGVTRVKLFGMSNPADNGIYYVRSVLSGGTVIQLVWCGQSCAPGILTATVGSAGGTGYTTGDLLTLVQGDGSGGVVQVTASAGVVTGVSSVTQEGFYYSTANDLATTGGTGTGAKINITSVTQYVTASGGTITFGNLDTENWNIQGYGGEQYLSFNASHCKTSDVGQPFTVAGSSSTFWNTHSGWYGNGSDPTCQTGNSQIFSIPAGSSTSGNVEIVQDNNYYTGITVGTPIPGPGYNLVTAISPLIMGAACTRDYLVGLGPQQTDPISLVPNTTRTILFDNYSELGPSEEQVGSWAPQNVSGSQLAFWAPWSRNQLFQRTQQFALQSKFGSPDYGPGFFALARGDTGSTYGNVIIGQSFWDNNEPVTTNLANYELSGKAVWFYYSEPLAGWTVRQIAAGTTSDTFTCGPTCTWAYVFSTKGAGEVTQAPCSPPIASPATAVSCRYGAPFPMSNLTSPNATSPVLIPVASLGTGGLMPADSQIPNSYQIVKTKTVSGAVMPVAIGDIQH